MTIPMTHAAGDVPRTAGLYAPDSLLTLIEIAELLGRNLKTVKTWNDKGKGRWPHAVQDEGGRQAWRVPVDDLVAAGDLPAAQVAHVQNELAARRESDATWQLRERVARLEEQLAAANSRADEHKATIALLTDLLTDRLTDRPTDRPTDRRSGRGAA